MRGGSIRWSAGCVGSLALSGVVATACTGELTELVVIVESDLRVPDEMERVVIVVDATELGGQTHTREAALAGAEAIPLPITLSLVHSGDGPLGPVHLAASARHGETDVVERRADVSFLQGETRAVVLALSRTCFGVVCPDGQTCIAGMCRSVIVAPEDLDPPGSDAGRGDAGSSDAGRSDAGPRDAGASDAGPAPCSCTRPHATTSCTDGVCSVTGCETGFGDCDLMPGNGCERPVNTAMDCAGCGTRCTRAHATATCATGTCRIAACHDRHSNLDGIDENGCEYEGCDPTRCSCMETCSDSGDCACTGGCPCTFTCEDDCRASCAGMGTRCTVRARDVSNLRLDCTDGATCTVDARDASNAEETRCETGASCEIDCDHVSNCVTECRSGASCRVRCGRMASNCSFSVCEGGEMSCPGDVIVCNRECP